MIPLHCENGIFNYLVFCYNVFFTKLPTLDGLLREELPKWHFPLRLFLFYPEWKLVIFVEKLKQTVSKNKASFHKIWIQTDMQASSFGKFSSVCYSKRFFVRNESPTLGKIFSRRLGQGFIRKSHF